jgi:hypothetical protein
LSMPRLGDVAKNTHGNFSTHVNKNAGNTQRLRRW